MEGHEILLQNLAPLRAFLKRNSINEHNIESIKGYLKGISLLTSFTFKQKITSFQRVTINHKVLGTNTRITEIKHLKYPPREYVKHYGRANGINESIFYATFDPLTALSEMRPKIGDLITVSTWELKTDYSLTVTPIFKNKTKDGEVYNEMALKTEIEYNKVKKQYDDQLSKQLDIILHFIADCFNKEVADDNHYDYYLSSHYANRIFTELLDGGIDAILCPSVRQSLTLNNIAIKPQVLDANYALKDVEESKITHTPNNTNKGWLMEGTGFSNVFTETNIIW